MIKIEKEIKISELTTLGIGGKVKYFCEAKSASEVCEAIEFSKKKEVDYFILGGGSNVLVSDAGYEGLVIKNRIEDLSEEGNTVRIGAGNNLQELVDLGVKNGFNGIQKLTMIPGTIGGAIRGNAGAYGASIGEFVKRVRIIDERLRIKWIEKIDCEFGYRESIFKKKKWVIVEGEFEFLAGDKKEIIAEEKGIREQRINKYPLTLKCPGSFFKNVEVNKVSKEAINKIPKDKIIEGKIPVGYLLEEVGMKGKTCGAIKIADYHANLLVNTGNGKAEEVIKLMEMGKNKVWSKFGIEIEPEVQMVGFEV